MAGDVAFISEDALSHPACPHAPPGHQGGGVIALIDRLVALLAELRRTDRTPADALAGLLRTIAASVIQHDATQARIPPGDWPREVVEAITSGARLADELAARKTAVRVETEVLPLGTPAARLTDRPVGIFGPFSNPVGQALRFLAFESAPLMSVVFRPAGAPPQASELWLRIPAGATPDDPLSQAWTLPAGTVWIRSRFVDAHTPGFTGLRIAGGALRIVGAVARENGTIVLSRGVQWTLDVEPERPAPATTTHSDGDAAAIQLPRHFVVQSAAPPALNGRPSVSGFGSDLVFTTDGAAPFFDGTQICFPLGMADPRWTITGNRSDLVHLAGAARIMSPSWALPVEPSGAAPVHDAPHGGSLTMRVGDVVDGTVAGQAGPPFRWHDSILTFNDLCIELDGRQVMPGGRYDRVELWEGATTSFHFTQRPLTRLLFRSERRGHGDAIAVSGGHCHTRWDLPRHADGRPAPFEGGIDLFGLIATDRGLLLTCAAARPSPDDTAGLALENLYVVVRPARRLAIVAAYDPPGSCDDGVSVLSFDGVFALPTLPDPYAANIGVSDGRQSRDQAVRVTLAWHDRKPPTVAAHLDAPVVFADAPVVPPRDDGEYAVYEGFRRHLESEPEPVYLLDMSSRDHLFGVALEPFSDRRVAVVENRLTLPLHRVRLLMQPQVHWEPVHIKPNPNVPTLVDEIVGSVSNGGPTLVGARSVTLVPTLPGAVSDSIVDAIHDNRRAAALFSLPFGLRAMARLSPNEAQDRTNVPGVDTTLHEPDFGGSRSARQLRLLARDISTNADQNASRYMPGMLRQLSNFEANQSGLASVTPNELLSAFGQFSQYIPLHHADLSGYGLSTFSDWRLQGDYGFTKVQFQVMNGRTAYEVLQFRSALYECGAPVVRTVIVERRSSGRVVRTDSGWVAVASGLFDKPVSFAKGCIKAFHNIRRIRITGGSIPLPGGAAVQPVLFDADAEIEGHPLGGFTKIVPIVDRPGYVQVQSSLPAPAPPQAPSLLTVADLAQMFERVGAIGSTIDCSLRVGGTLDVQVSSITSNLAPDDMNGTGFAVAAVGSPALPRAGQWTAVRVDPNTQEAAPVDARRGVPFVRDVGGSYVVREPSDARRTSPRAPYGFLMTTQSSRVLFPQPRISPTDQGRIATLPPVVADPYSLVQGTGAFPRAAYALRLNEAAGFVVSNDNSWRIQNPAFTFSNPIPNLLQGGEWKMDRSYLTGSPIVLNLDAAAPIPWDIAVPQSDLDLDLPMFPGPLQKIFKLRTKYVAQSAGLPKLATPELLFEGALKDLKEVLDALSHLAGLPFDVDVTVTAGSGPTPSFLVRMRLVFRIGEGRDRIDIGVGKFYGQITLLGALEASPAGVANATLLLEFQGDVQQGILPPLLYAGGLFRFGITLRQSGRPEIQLVLGVVASIGGDLIKGLLEVEVTVKYGYTLIPETLEPGVLLGLEARAKLLAGLIGFSFSVEAMARIRRATPEKVTVWAKIRVAASVQVAIFIEEDVDFETQFEQDIPLALAALVPGGQLLGGLSAAVSEA